MTICQYSPKKRDDLFIKQKRRLTICQYLTKKIELFLFDFLTKKRLTTDSSGAIIKNEEPIGGDKMAERQKIATLIVRVYDGEDRVAAALAELRSSGTDINKAIKTAIVSWVEGRQQQEQTGDLP